MTSKLRVLPSREGKEPSGNHYANLLAYLAEVYPGAKMDHEEALKLKPVWDALCRAGRTPEQTAQSTCTCDGKKIFASPAIEVRYSRGLARAPLHAERGRLFPLSDARESAYIEGSKRSATKAAERAKKINEKIRAFAQRVAANPPRNDAQAEGRKSQLAKLEAELREAIDIARSHLLEVDANRATEDAAASYGVWRKHLPKLSVPERAESPDLSVKPKERKTKKKARAAVETPRPATETAKPKKAKAKKTTAKAENKSMATSTEKQKQLTEAEQERAVTAALGETLAAVLAKLTKPTGK